MKVEILIIKYNFLVKIIFLIKKYDMATIIFKKINIFKNFNPRFESLSNLGLSIGLVGLNQTEPKTKQTNRRGH